MVNTTTMALTPMLPRSAPQHSSMDYLGIATPDSGMLVFERKLNLVLHTSDG